MSDVIALGLASGLPVQPEDSIEHIAATQAGEFERFEQSLSKSIQKLILGQTLTSDVGASGSYAAAKVHAQVQETKRNADIRLITKTVQALINNLCTLNAIANPPEFVMADGTGLELDRANRDKTLVEAGILTLTEDYILDRYDFKEGDFTMPEPATEAPEAPSAPDAPDPADPEAQPSSANMAASTTVRPRFTAGQQAIEDQVERTLSNFVSPITHKAIASAIAGATSPDDLIERLGVAMADSTDAQFRQTLERALFAADLMGYGQAQKQQA
jgi:phage gp29-like protein